MLKTEEVDGYTVRELSVRELMPMMEGGIEGSDFQMALLKTCVTDGGGNPIGDALMDLGVSTYMKLVNAAMRVNGMDEAGNG